MKNGPGMAVTKMNVTTGLESVPEENYMNQPEGHIKRGRKEEVRREKTTSRLSD